MLSESGRARRTERPEVAARVKAAYAKLDDARARLGADRWQDAVDRVTPIVKEAEALGYKPLLGEALLIEGSARAFQRDEAAEPALRRSMLASLSGRDDLGSPVTVRGSSKTALSIAGAAAGRGPRWRAGGSPARTREIPGNFGRVRRTLGHRAFTRQIERAHCWLIGQIPEHLLQIGCASGSSTLGSQ